MRRSEDVRSKDHAHIFDHPDLYTFVDISQNNAWAGLGQKHDDNILYVREHLAKHPRPINNNKNYGAARHGEEDSVARFCRIVFAGCAGVRFHRPHPREDPDADEAATDFGLGLSPRAQAIIASMREIAHAIEFVSTAPRNDLLSDRSPNEADCLAEPSRQYAVYFPDGGAVKRVLSILLAGLPMSLGAASPRLVYESSWIGNSYPGAQRWVPQDIDHLFVTADGTVYSNVHWEEGGGNVTAFKDGDVLGPARRTHGWGNQAGYAVAANDKYLYIAGRMNNEGGGLKDPDTWPPKGFDWIGVSRRQRSDIQKGAPFPGGKGGKGDTLPRAFLVVDEVQTGSGPDERRLRNITGLWSTKERLYVSCPYDDTIKVFDAESMARLDEWALERPGVMAMDGDGVLWMLLEPRGTSPQEIIALNPRTGERTGPAIRLQEGVAAKAICFTVDGRLLVADAGPAQQIHSYDFPAGESPRLAGTFGVRGGIYASPSGRFGDLRFNMPSGVGSDADGNIYVAHQGSTGGGSTVLESYASEGQLNWRLFGLNFVDMADVDPASDTEVFTKEERFTMDYSEPPGRQWTYQGYTVHPFRYPQDPRLHIWSAGVWVRRMEGRRFLFVNDMNAQHLQVYRFDADSDDETAIPSGLFAGGPIRNDDSWPPHQPEAGEWIWRDRNGNGAFDPGEYDRNDGRDAPSYQGWWVDDAGTVWQATRTSGIRRFPMQGLDVHGNPLWDYASMTVFDHPREFKEVKRLRYDPAEDVMVLGGTTEVHANQHWKPMGPAIARYDNWSGPDRALRWRIVAPYQKGSSGHHSCEPMGFDIAGDYFFVPYTGASREMGFSTGHIEVFRLVGCHPRRPDPDITERTTDRRGRKRECTGLCS